MAALTALALWLYWPVLSGGLVWDDREIIRQLQQVAAESWVSQVFFYPYLGDEYYRPFVQLTLMANANSGLPFVWAAHATNLLIYLLCLNVLLLLFYQQHGTENLLPTLVAGLVFVLHPAFIELVAWISGRCDLLLIFFTLAGLAIDASALPVMWRRCGVLLGFMLALLSKETGVLFPVFLFGLRMLRTENKGWTLSHLPRWIWRSQKMDVLLLLGGFAGYMLLRYHTLGLLMHTGEQASRNVGNIFQHSAYIFKTAYWYCVLAIFPQVDVSPVYPVPVPVNILTRESVLGFGLLAGGMFVMVAPRFTFRAKLGVAMMALLFLPIANIHVLPIEDNLIHLRYLALPVVALILVLLPVVLQGVQRAGPRWQAFVVAVLFVWCVSAVMTIRSIVPLWRSNLSLWHWVAVTKPTSQLGWQNYTSNLFVSGNFELCLSAVDQAQAWQPNNPSIHANGALCAEELGRYQQAQYYVDAVLASPAVTPQVYSRMLTLDVLLSLQQVTAVPATGMTLAQRDQGYLMRARELDPDNPMLAPVGILLALKYAPEIDARAYFQQPFQVEEVRRYLKSIPGEPGVLTRRLDSMMTSLK